MEAVDNFIVQIETAQELQEDIASRIDDFFGLAPENVNWADVGTIAHVVGLLQEIHNFLGLGKK